MTSKTKLGVNLRIAIIQLNSQIGQVAQNVSRATILINKLKDKLNSSSAERNPDLVVFPEFALTGYNFHSRSHILPYTCTVKNGPSYELAKKVSLMFGCYTIIGYPERVTEEINSKLYNSAVVVGPDGDLVFNYRKSFLYDTDEEWGCQENPKGFQSFPLTFKKRARAVKEDSKNDAIDVTLRTSIGICMDLSPYKFKAPFQDFEFATYNIDNNNELIICPMAWLHSSSVTDNSNSDAKLKQLKIKQDLEKQGLPTYGSQGDFQMDFDNEKSTVRTSFAKEVEYTGLSNPDMSNVNYWILRFMPFLGLKYRYEWSVTDLFYLIKKSVRSSYMGATMNERWKFKEKNSIVVMANRCGIEDGRTVFAGSSGIYKYNGKYDDEEIETGSKNRSVELLGNLGKGLEGVIMRDVSFDILR